MPEENEIELGDDDKSTPPEENQDKKSDKSSDKLDPEIQRRDAQIAHWREKAEKAEGELKTYKPEKAKSKEDVEEWQASKDPLEIVRLGKSLKDYDEDETEFIIRNAQSKNIDGIMKAEKDEMVQMAIKSRREKLAKENKVPSPSSPGGGLNEKSPAEIAKMTRDEHIAYEKQMLESQRSQGI